MTILNLAFFIVQFKSLGTVCSLFIRLSLASLPTKTHNSFIFYFERPQGYLLHFLSFLI